MSLGARGGTSRTPCLFKVADLAADCTQRAGRAEPLEHRTDRPMAAVEAGAGGRGALRPDHGPALSPRHRFRPLAAGQGPEAVHLRPAGARASPVRAQRAVRLMSQAALFDAQPIAGLLNSCVAEASRPPLLHTVSSLDTRRSDTLSDGAVAQRPSTAFSCPARARSREETYRKLLRSGQSARGLLTLKWAGAEAVCLFLDLFAIMPAAAVIPSGVHCSPVQFSAVQPAPVSAGCHLEKFAGEFVATLI